MEKLQEIIDNSNNIVFFGGAGVSTESGLKDFRSQNGIYNMKYNIPPETILSHSFFMNHCEEFYDFYRNFILYDENKVKPNICHFKLKELEDIGKLKAIITQNIDGLHQKAGSKNVIELHGTIMKNYCCQCFKEFDGYNFIKKCQKIPRCDECGGIIKPKVVLYEESLDDSCLNKAIYFIENCDTLIVAGTSLTVYPAAGLIRYFKGKNLVIINYQTTNYDQIADLIINDSICKTFANIKI